MDVADPVRHAGWVSSPVLLAVDGNSLLHRAHHAWAGSQETDGDGRPTWGLRGLLGQISAAAARFTPDALVVGFDCREHSIRKAEFAGYKAQRPDKPADLQAQAGDAPDLLRQAGLPVVTPHGYEADDVLASAAALARRDGWQSILVTSDRDSFALIDPTTSVLRVMNGGIEGSPLLTPAALATVCAVGGGQYQDFAVLRGDPSDNLPGVAGVGARTAARLLAAFPGLDAVYAAIDDGRLDEVAAVVGPVIAGRMATSQVRDDLMRNRRLMTMRADLDLPALADLRLPLDPGRLTAALAARGIRLGDSVWALVGGRRPAWTPPGFDKAPKHLPGAVPSPWRAGWLDSVMPPAAVAAAAPARPAVSVRRRGSRPHPVTAGQLRLF